jgi:hypothetical protein
MIHTKIEMDFELHKNQRMISNRITLKKFQALCRERMAIVRGITPFSHNGAILQYTDIFTFSSFAGRDMNDANNRKREPIISAIINGTVPSEYQYSIVWRNFTERLLEFVDNLFLEEELSQPHRTTCKIMAGRNHNYDFLITKETNGTKSSKKVEFKFNSKKITGCPQFLSVSSKVNTSYAEYFYDNCVERLTELYGLDEKIDRSTYLKSVHQTNYSKHKWFSSLYNLECEGDEKHKMKKRIVDESIHTYLTEHYFTECDSMEELIGFWNTKFRDTQGEKIYMLYCPKEKRFYRDEITSNELTISAEHMGIQSGKSDNVHTLVFYTGEDRATSIKLLLRWRNHSGILNPAWQISIHR